MWLPETNYFQAIAAEREARLEAEKAGTLPAEGGDANPEIKAAGLRAYLRENGKAAKANWVLLIYMVILMAGFNACSHGSQDFYPTFLKNQVELGPSDVTVITVVGQIGSLIGACTLGYISTFTGRRLIMIIACFFGGAIIPAYILPRDMTLVASSFFQQFFVGGVWGPIPIHLIELSPPQMRALVVGLTYQLGNLASSASATIQGVIGERYPIPPAPDGTKRFDYGRVIAIFMGGVWAYQLVFLFLGPEMSEQERMEFAEESEDLERLRRQGVMVSEYGRERARLGQKVLDAEGSEEGHQNGSEKAAEMQYKEGEVV